MERLFTSFDAYLSRRLNGSEPTQAQKLVLAYFIKSEWANRQERHTILLTPDNNHYTEINALEQAGLIEKHPDSPPLYPIYLADRELLKENYAEELRKMLGEVFDELTPINKECLEVIYRHQYFSRLTTLNALQVARFLWVKQGKSDAEQRDFYNFARSVRYAFNRLTNNGFLVKQGRTGYTLNETYQDQRLL